MFRTRGLIFRKTVVTSTGTVYLSACVVQSDTSECGYATVKASKVAWPYPYLLQLSSWR